MAWPPIHWESKFDCERYPVKAVPMEPRKPTTPVIQVSARLPRQAAMKNFPHRWIDHEREEQLHAPQVQ